MSCFRVVCFILFSVISLNYGFYIREPVQGSNSLRNMSPAMTYDDFLRWTTIYSTNLRKLGVYPVVTADDERRSVELFNQNFAEFLRINRDDESLESAEVISFENLENGVNNYVTINTDLNAKEFDINNIQTGPTYAISNNDAEQVFDITSNWVGTDPSNYFIVVKNGENLQVNQADGTETVSKGKTDSDSDTKDDYIEENFEDIPTFIEALSSLDWELEPEIVNSANNSTEASDIFDEVWERDEQNEREMGMVMNVLGVDGQSLIEDVAKIMGDEDEQFSEDLGDLIAMESSQEEKTISFRPSEEASSEYSDERMPAQIIEPRIENVSSSPDSNMYAANEEAFDHLENSPDPRITPPRILEITDTKLDGITNEPATNSASSKREQEDISTSPIENSVIEPTASKSEAHPSNDTIEDILGEVSTDTADDFQFSLSSKQILKSETNEVMESLLISPEELLNYFVDTPTSLNTTESQPESLNPDAVHLERKEVQQREKASKDRHATGTVDSVLISPDELFEIMEIDSINITSGSNHIPQYVFDGSTGTKFEQQETRFEEKSLNTTLKNNENQDRDFKDHPSSLKLPESESSDESLANQMEDSLEQEPSNTVEQTTYNHVNEDIAKKPENLAPGSFTTLISPHYEIPSIDSALMESVSTASLKDKDLLKNVETNVGGKFGTGQLINMSSENVSSSNQIIRENISKGLVPSSISPTKDINSPAQKVSENQSEPLNSDASNRGHYVAELEVVEGVLQLYNDPLKESSSKKRILEPLEPETLQTLYNEVPTSQNQPKPQNKSIQIQIENSISVKNTSMKVDSVDDTQKKYAAIEKIIQEEPLGSSEPKRDDDDDSWEDGTLIPIIFPNMNITEVDSTAETWKEDQSLRISGADRIENEEKALNTTHKSNDHQGSVVIKNHPSSSKPPEFESSDEILPTQMEDIDQVFKNPLVSSENTTVTEINNLKEINAYKVLTTPKNNTNLKQIAESDTLKDDANDDFVPVQIGEFIGKSYSKQSTIEDITEEDLKPILGKMKQPNYNVYMPFDLLNENEKAYDIFKPKTEDEDDSDDSEEIPKIHQYNDRSDIPIQDYSDYYDYRDDYQL